MVATGTGTGKDPSVSSKLSTQPATTTSPSVPQTTPPLLPVFTETARARRPRGRPSPAAYRLRSILINLLQVVSVIVIGFV
jgi:hypothetical protein